MTKLARCSFVRRFGAPVLVLLCSAMPAAADVCRPRLTVEKTALSPMQEMQRVWTATVLADASACAAASGPFEIRIVRLKENGLDLAFSERFTWRAGRSDVSLEFWADEAVLSYELGAVAPCACRR